MIYGIGCDICAIARMETILQKSNAAHFLRRVFAPSELALFGLAGQKGTSDCVKTPPKTPKMWYNSSDENTIRSCENELRNIRI